MKAVLFMSAALIINAVTMYAARADQSEDALNSMQKIVETQLDSDDAAAAAAAVLKVTTPPVKVVTAAAQAEDTGD